MDKFILILLVIGGIVWWLNPHIDYTVDTYTDEGWYLLWYGHRWRRYIRLFKYKKHE